MRLALVTVLALLWGAAGSAQTPYLNTGQRGLGVAVTAARATGVGPYDRTASGFGAGLTGTPVSGLDLGVAVLRQHGSVSPRPYTTTTGSVVGHVINNEASLLGLFGAVTFVTDGPAGDETLGTAGLVAAWRQPLEVEGGGFTAVPQVSFAVVAARGGAAFGASATPAVLWGRGSTRLAVEPSLGYEFGDGAFTLGLAVGVVQVL